MVRAYLGILAALGGFSALARNETTGEQFRRLMQSECAHLLAALPAALTLRRADRYTDERTRPIETAADSLKELLDGDLPARFQRTDYEAVSFLSDFFPSGELSRRDIQTAHQALVHLKWMDTFEDDLLSHYDQWTGGPRFKVDSNPRTLNELLLYPDEKARKDEGRDELREKYSAKPLSLWVSKGAKQAFRTVDADTSSRLRLDPREYPQQTREELVEGYLRLRRAGRVPQIFLPWLDRHEAICRHWNVQPSTLYYALLNDLHALHLQPSR